jgi:hypothetical protein
MPTVHQLVDLSGSTVNFKIFGLMDVDGIGSEAHS